MKILLANKYFFQKGGAETVFLQERNFLLSIGVEVVDFSMHDSRNLPSPYSDYFVKERDYRATGKKALSKISDALSLIHSPEAVKNITRLIDKEKPDILHCHNIYHQLTPSILLAAKRMGVPVVLTLHDYKPMCPVYNRLCGGKPCSACLTGNFSNVVVNRCAEGSLLKSVLLYAEATFQQLRGSYEAIDKVIAVSQFMYDSATRGRFPQNRVTLLYNGVDVQEFSRTETNDGQYILYLGRLSKEKGLLTLGQAQAGTNIRVILAGTGPVETMLRQSFPELEFVGHQSGENLRQLICNASAIVLPSEWYENCPMSALEAMAAGKPVIGSRMGGIPELVTNGETGLLYTASDAPALRRAMTDIMSNKELRISMGKKGRARAEEKFSLGVHNQGLLNIYNDVLSARTATSTTNYS